MIYHRHHFAILPAAAAEEARYALHTIRLASDGSTAACGFISQIHCKIYA